MPIFEYQALDQQGKTVKGKIDSPSEKQATNTLQSQKLYPLSIKETKKTFSKVKGKKKGLLQGSVPISVITDFTRQFAILVEASIPYDKGLEIIIQECDHSTFQNVLSDLKARIVEGSSLANALHYHPKLFSKMYTSMVKAGEAGGKLPTVLLRLAKFREEEADLKEKVKNAMIYPSIMGILGIGIVIFMITFILPKIIPIFDSFGVQLPLPTRIVIIASDLIVNYGWWILLGIIGIIFGIKKLINSNKGELVYHQMLLKTPMIKGVLFKILIFRFTQSLGTLLNSGVELRKSLEIVKFTTGNRIFEKAVDAITQDITQKGLPLSQALKKTKLFTGTVIQMIKVGEESSQLDTLLVKVADNLEKEVRETMNRLVTFLEPMIMFGMAGFVGFIVVAILLPMFQINQLF